MNFDLLVQQALDTLRGMWRQRWVGVGVAWTAGVIAALLVSLIPNRYEAGARVYVDTKTVLRPLMRDLTVEPDVDQTVNLLAKTLITRPNVELLLRRSKLGPESMPQLERDLLIDTLTRQITVTGSGRDNVFTFSYRDPDPEKARLVVKNLVELFLESDSGAKKRDSEAARGFIDDQIKQYETRLAEAEGRLKDFKLRNIDMTDPGGRDYFARMSALTEDLAKLTVELRAAEQAREALRHEMDGETLSLLPDPSTPVAVIAAPEIEARIEAQRKQLDDLLRRYTDLHPDVISTKRLIESLEKDREQEIEKRRIAAASRPASRASGSTPMVQQIKLALAEAEANVASIKVRSADMQSRLGQLRASVNRVPQLEAELAQLNRDYEVVRRTYETMVARREQASLSEDVDSTRAAQFRVIDPPRTAPNPVFPNRRALAPLVLLLALAAGLAASFLMVQLVPTFDNARALRLTTQRPVLGSVSMRTTAPLLRSRRHELFGFGSAVGGLVLVTVIWIVWMALAARGGVA